MGDLTLNLSRREFGCRCPECTEKTPVADYELVTTIQKAVDHFSKVKERRLSVIITSSYRCPVKNKSVGGAPESMHLSMLAADIIIPGVSPQDLGEYLEQLSGGNKWGIGVYPDKGHVHIDMRPVKARW